VTKSIFVTYDHYIKKKKFNLIQQCFSVQPMIRLRIYVIIINKYDILPQLRRQNRAPLLKDMVPTLSVLSAEKANYRFAIKRIYWWHSIFLYSDSCHTQVFVQMY